MLLQKPNSASENFPRTSPVDALLALSLPWHALSGPAGAFEDSAHATKKQPYPSIIVFASVHPMN